MERRKLLLVGVILMASLFLLLSCGNIESGKQSNIVGYWYRIDSEDHVELYHDKTFKFDNGNNGNWILLDDGRIKFTTTGGEIYMGMLDDEALMIMFNNKKGEVFFKHPDVAPAQNISKLIGKWKNNDGMIFEFRPDGTIKTTNARGATRTSRFVLMGKFIKIMPKYTAKIEISTVDFSLSYLEFGVMTENFRKVN